MTTNSPFSTAIFSLCLIVSGMHISPSLAQEDKGDKSYVELVCGDTKASIACTKFVGKVCTASALSFDMKDGTHLVSKYTPPQKSASPSIVDGLQCATTAKGTFFAVSATPNCFSAQCVTNEWFDQAGHVLPHNDKEFKKVFGLPPIELSPNGGITLRGDTNDNE